MHLWRLVRTFRYFISAVMPTLSHIFIVKYNHLAVNNVVETNFLLTAKRFASGRREFHILTTWSLHKLLFEETFFCKHTSANSKTSAIRVWLSDS